MEKVSVIVAVYNVKQYLAECVESIIGQTYKDLEIILVDDGSTDGSGEICDEFMKRDKRIKVVHQKNQGLSAVRNNGMKVAASDYIMFVDGDDFVDKKYVEKLLAGLKKNDADVAVCGFMTHPGHQILHVPEGALTGEKATIKLLTEQENYQIVSWNKIYKKNLFDGILFPVGEKHEDSLTTYKVLYAAKNVAFVDDSLYCYRQREDSIMGSVEIGKRLKIKLKAAEEAVKYFEAKEHLSDAAKISELLAYNSFLNEIIAGRLKEKCEPYFDWIRNHKRELLTNEFMTMKLRIYIYMSTIGNGLLYKVFRKIKQ